MRSFFIDPRDVEKGKVKLKGEEFHHAVDVTRIRPGEEIRGVDGRGKEYFLRVSEINEKGGFLKAEILHVQDSRCESPYDIFLGFGLVKGPRIDYLIEKATEIGVKGFVPFISSRSVVKSLEKKERWRKIAISAVKQSGRAEVPQFADPIDFEEVIALKDEFKQGLVASPLSENSLREIELGDSILLLIGPEGGLTPEEIKMAERQGFETFSLGPRTLRTETASLAALAIIFFKKGEW